MKRINCLLSTILIILFTFIFLKIGFRLIYRLLSFWYITIPLALAMYFLFSASNKKPGKAARNGLDPSKEVKLDQEPKVNDFESDIENDDNGGDKQ